MSEPSQGALPRVHVVVPYWGPAELLHAAAASVLAQSDPGWTLTIVDDCFPDRAVQHSYADHPDPRVTYLRNEVNLGTSGNFERCRQVVVERGGGELCVFLGCDDLLDATFVERVRDVHRDHPRAAVIQPGVRVIDDEGHEVRGLTEAVKEWLTPHVEAPRELGGESLATSLLHGNWLYWPSLVFRVDVLRERRFRQDLPILLDLALVLDLVLAGEVLVLDPVKTFRYRRHEASASATSRFDGRRFSDEARFHAEVADRLRKLGWKRAHRAARLRATSRLHAVALLPGALRDRSWHQVRTLLHHAAGG